jgi:hypothetical protein
MTQMKYCIFLSSPSSGVSLIFVWRLVFVEKSGMDLSSSISKMTGYRLNDWGSISGRTATFILATKSWPALWLTQSYSQWVLGYSVVYSGRSVKPSTHTISMQCGPETSLFWDTSTWSVYVACAERFPVENFLISMVLVFVDSIQSAAVCYDFGSRKLLNFGEGRKYVWSEVMCTAVWIWKWRRVVPCNSLQNELHKRLICRYESYPWWSDRKFSSGETVVCWKFPHPPDTQLS